MPKPKSQPHIVEIIERAKAVPGGLGSKHGAGLLADAINTYWHSRGYSTVAAERYLMVGTKAWGIRSNLVAGLPPLRRGGGK